jgi:hypothetical protein
MSCVGATVASATQKCCYVNCFLGTEEANVAAATAINSQRFAPGLLTLQGPPGWTTCCCLSLRDTFHQKLTAARKASTLASFMTADQHASLAHAQKGTTLLTRADS